MRKGGVRALDKAVLNNHIPRHVGFHGAEVALRVNPGDIVVGDQDSVIVIDPSDVERLVAAAKARIHRDEMMHVAISKGSTLFQEIGCGERLQSIGAVIKEGHWKVTD
jgi:regulator of RNase E activity RraA